MNAKAPRLLTRGELVIKFIETYCIVPDGEHIGKPMSLEPFQRKFIIAIYDNPKTTLRAYLSMGRKCGKTCLIACIVLAHLVGPEARRNSQIISGAQSRDQAALIFDLASKMVMLNPDLRDIIRIVPSHKQLVGLTRNTEYHAISAEGKTAYGLSPVLALLDEVGQVRGPQDKFIDAITTSQGAHLNPLLIAISTQAANDADMFSVWIDDAKTNKDPHTVCHLYAADADCELLDKDAWKAANPALGKFRSLVDMKSLAGKADRMPSFEPTFRNLNLNQRAEIFSPFVSKGVWIANSEAPDRTAFYDNNKVYAGIDLSGTVDLTSIVLVAFKNARWHVLPYFWTPEKGLKERARQARTPFDVWAKKGLIRVVPGASIDYEVVAKDFVDIVEGMRIEVAAFDRWRIHDFRRELDKVQPGMNLAPFGQGFRDMSPALEAVEAALMNDRVSHGGHPVLTMCAMNSRVEKDPAGNRKLSKLKATGRIDGMVALCMALGVCNAVPERVPEFQAFFFGGDK